MKIEIDPMKFLRLRAKAMINKSINAEANGRTHIEAAHRAKRRQAETVLSGGPATVEFAGEAELRGISIEEFAQMIVAKPDELAERELDRQRALIAVDAATSRYDIERAMDDVGIKFTEDERQ